MSLNEVFSIIGKYLAVGLTSTGIAYGLFTYFGKAWIDKYFAKELESFKTKQAQELEHYRFEMNSLFNRISKLHEKELEVLPEAWNKLAWASGKVIGVVSPMQHYYDLNRMTDLEVDEALITFNLRQSQIDQIKESTDKTETLKQIEIDLNYYEARKIVQEFHNYIIIYKIFLSKELFDSFTTADTKFTEILNDWNYLRSEHKWQPGSEFISNSDKVIQVTEEIASKIQKRLHVHDVN